MDHAFGRRALRAGTARGYAQGSFGFNGLPPMSSADIFSPMGEPIRTIQFWRGLLPHWEVVDGRYFVTLRLANSLPHSVASELDAILRDADEEDFQKRSRCYFRKLEHWLDANHGLLHLKNPEVAQMLMGAMTHYENIGYWKVSSATVMPNHIHMFFRCGTLGMSKAMKRFKQYTAREANRILGTKGTRFWQREWFDHWSRSAMEDDRIISYIRNNPVRAGLCADSDDWPWTRP